MCDGRQFRVCVRVDSPGCVSVESPGCVRV